MIIVPLEANCRQFQANHERLLLQRVKDFVGDVVVEAMQIVQLELVELDRTHKMLEASETVQVEGLVHDGQLPQALLAL